MAVAEDEEAVEGGAPVGPRFWQRDSVVLAIPGTERPASNMLALPWGKPGRYGWTRGGRGQVGVAGQ